MRSEYNTTGGVPHGTPGSPSTLTLSNLPAHTSVDLSFLPGIINSWDGDPPFLDAGPDVFNVTVDGASVFSNTFDNVNYPLYQGYVPPPGVDVGPHHDLGFGYDPYIDGAFNMGAD